MFLRNLLGSLSLSRSDTLIFVNKTMCRAMDDTPIPSHFAELREMASPNCLISST